MISHELGGNAVKQLGGSAVKLRPSGYLAWKSSVDRLVAIVLLIPGVFLIVALSALIRLTSKGKAIYSQRRVGKDGRVYTMYKLRSMRQDAEDKSGPVWSAAGADPRVTLLGYWLRKLHLDELPQLFNVLRGEMSLIGPRPERPEFVRVLAESIPGYLDRLSVLPGVTGLAQINLPPDTDLDSVRRKLILDMEYVRNASLLLDARMLLCTLFRMIGMKGELAMKVLKLKRKVILPPTPIAASEASPETRFPSEITPSTIAATLQADPAIDAISRKSFPNNDASNPEDSGILAHSTN